MSKLSRLRDNIAALQEAFEPKNGEYDYEVLEKYSGFGGLGFVLNPLDKSKWTKTDQDCYDDTVRLHELLHKYSNSEQEYAHRARRTADIAEQYLEVGDVHLARDVEAVARRADEVSRFLKDARADVGFGEHQKLIFPRSIEENVSRRRGREYHIEPAAEDVLCGNYGEYARKRRNFQVEHCGQHQ